MKASKYDLRNATNRAESFPQCWGFRSLQAFAATLFFAVTMLLLLSTGLSWASGLKVERVVRSYHIAASLDRYPLVLGDNSIEIDLKDKTGQRISDAKVLVNYYMPPMPRMVPMNYKTVAESESEGYVAKMNIIMAGPWYIKIIIRDKDRIVTTKFNVDAQ
jgi:hypothetical protein